jgi:hypothetical protein
MRPFRLLSAASILALVAGPALVGCSSAEESDSSSDALEGDARALWSDAKQLNLDDLSRVAAKFATDGFNDALGGDIGARVETKVYGRQAEPNRVLPNSTEIRGLDEIVTNLEARLGGTELGSRLNRTRLQSIEAGRASHFVESSFAFRAGIGHDWSFTPGGLADGSASIGLHAGTELESRVVLATDNAGLDAMVDAPLAAAKGTRGFIAPRSIEDIRKMVPGESFALRGNGKLATNLGLGVPVLTAGGPIGYEIVVSAGIGAVFEGRLDVQLMRLSGDEVIVDVGIDKLKGFKLHAAIEDHFGIKGLCDDGVACLRDVNLGGKNVNLQKFVERAVEKKLNKHFKTRAAISYEKEKERIGLTRVRFNLDKGNPQEVARALEQALKFDLRLAEAMSNRDLGQQNAGVVVEFDAVRSTTTTTLDFGFDLAGIDIYDRVVVKRNGTFVLQSPEGATLLTFDQLEKDRKLFQTTHGVTRMGVGALSVDARKPGAWKSEANLFVRTRFGDEHIHDDRFVDGLDAVIGSLAGKGAVAALDRSGSAIEQQLWAECPREQNPSGGYFPYGPEGNTCNIRLLNGPFAGLRAQGATDLAGAVREPHIAPLIAKAGELRLALQSVMFQGHAADTDGPAMAMTIDQRFDDAALAILTKKTEAEYRTALVDYLTILSVDRKAIGAGSSRDAARAEVERKMGDKIAKMSQTFAAGAGTYSKIADGEAELIGILQRNNKRFVSTPVGIRFAVDRDSREQLETEVMSSSAAERAQAITDLFDNLYKKSEKADVDVALYEEHAAVFPLVALVPAKNLKVALNVNISGMDDGKITERERFRVANLPTINETAKGPAVSEITLGAFDLETALTTKQR